MRGHITVRRDEMPNPVLLFFRHVTFASGQFPALLFLGGKPLPIIGPLIPSPKAYRLMPDSGAVAGVLIISVCAILFWTVVFGAAYFARLSLRRKDSSISAANFR
jgi:hypothetical protein